MKRILFLVCLIVAVAGCSQQKDIDLNTYDGKGLEFVHFASSSDSWLIQENSPSYVKDVVVACTYKFDKDVTYNVSVGENTTGVEGKDFRIATKSVTIPAGEYSGKLPVEILYETTGEGFNLELVLEVEESKINPFYGNASAIVIKTDKINIDWGWLAGKWVAQDDSSDPGSTYKMEIVKVDETTAEFIGEWACSGSMIGTVDFAARTVTFTGEFALDEMYNGVLKVRPANGNTFTANLSPLGIEITNMNFYLVGGDYAGHDFGNDRTVLTKP